MERKLRNLREIVFLFRNKRGLFLLTSFFFFLSPAHFSQPAPCMFPFTTQLEVVSMWWLSSLWLMFFFCCCVFWKTKADSSFSIWNRRGNFESLSFEFRTRRDTYFWIIGGWVASEWECWLSWRINQVTPVLCERSKAKEYWIAMQSLL